MKNNKKTGLREGFSTGACAAAAAKAASLALLKKDNSIDHIELHFPDGLVRTLEIKKIETCSSFEATASIIKDAGDDPDVTHGIEIKSKIKIIDPRPSDELEIVIKGGEGVGLITKPGLAVEVGQPAINPVPKQMIKEAVAEVFKGTYSKIEVTIIVPKGKKIAKHTLNERLGIKNGISILGTTGIVKPISEAAWCATISISMDVALAAGLDAICLSTGRTSEAVAMDVLGLQDEAFISMGDYVGFALKEAAKKPFKKIYLACQWSKLVKMAMGWDQTHVRFGVLDPKEACAFIEKHFDFSFKKEQANINTVRQVLGIIAKKDKSIIEGVCTLALKRLREFLPQNKHLKILLISYEKELIHQEPKL